MNKKGFIFVETIIVIGVMLGSLMVIYSLYINTKADDNKRLRYDDPAKVYQTFYIKKYLESFDLSEIVSNITVNEPVLYIYSSNKQIFGADAGRESEFLQKIFNTLHITKIIIMKYDIPYLVSCDTGSGFYSKYKSLCSDSGLIEYLRTLDNDSTSNNDYRMIIVYESDKEGNGCSNNVNCYKYYTSVKMSGELYE